MSRNFWEQERRSLFKYRFKEYQAEGYSKEEAGSLAKKEVDEMMVEKEDFVHNIWEQSYEEE
jgi:hypothetical protein|tara:strand:+ start:66 stop:251 length:186 start_codon:yes stop_codon:yes gene_type:complete